MTNDPNSTDPSNPAASARGVELASDYTVSLHYDQRMYRQDIAGSIAHARMLSRQGIIGEDESNQIIDGLEKIQIEIESGDFPWKPELEDIHMNVESRLFDLIGDVSGRLHTARSRNDQVSTDTRLYMKQACADTIGALRTLQGALVTVAQANLTTVVPGYTHLQRAQPVLLAHHLLAYFEMFDRDATRFAAAQASADVLTLGNGAMAGVPYPIDREFVAKELGFSGITANSMDGVSDRDFALEYLSAAAISAMHLSRLAEEFVIWSSEEFGFLSLPENYTTGSSIMPQKRNPDFAELARGKTGRVYGNLFAMLTTLKGLPLTYNRDLQEDKEGLFDSVDTLLATLDVSAGMVEGANFNADRMSGATESSYVLATDIADYLVGKGMPFREAHVIVSALSDRLIDGGRYFKDLSFDEYYAASPLFERNVMDIGIDSSIASRDVHGGTAPGRVKAALEEAKRRLKEAGE
ncbi:MAG TPA: argininosuccinate lyase [Dehalococcoidia bacterium]|nr:argininosuccinate lyase [Dehalococcoidia bacterium]